MVLDLAIFDYIENAYAAAILVSLFSFIGVSSLLFFQCLDRKRVEYL